MLKKQLTNILPGTLPNDVTVVNKILVYDSGVLKQGDNNYEFLELKKNNLDAKKNKIRNLVAGVNDGDTVCYSQKPKTSVDTWDFNKKTLSNNLPCVRPDDCVTRRQAIINGGDDVYNAHNKIIRHVGKADLRAFCNDRVTTSVNFQNSLFD